MHTDSFLSFPIFLDCFYIVKVIAAYTFSFLEIISEIGGERERENMR